MRPKLYPVAEMCRDCDMRVGQILYGYCGGFFGRVGYDDKRIEALGFDWVVCRDRMNNLYFGCTPGEDVA